MDAIDTNILVRVITRDDEAMYQRAVAALTDADIVVPTTVLLEAEWVLRARYGFPREAVAASLEAFLGLPQVATPDADAVAAALRMLRGGLDFADALHVATSSHATRFVTLDEALVRRAARHTPPLPVVLA